MAILFWAISTARPRSFLSIRSGTTTGGCVFGFPPQLTRYIVSKGSLAVDGISLTVAEIEGEIVSFHRDSAHLRSHHPSYLRQRVACQHRSRHPGQAPGALASRARSRASSPCPAISSRYLPTPLLPRRAGGAQRTLRRHEVLSCRRRASVRPSCATKSCKATNATRSLHIGHAYRVGPVLEFDSRLTARRRMDSVVIDDRSGRQYKALSRRPRSTESDIRARDGTKSWPA